MSNTIVTIKLSVPQVNLVLNALRVEQVRSHALGADPGARPPGMTHVQVREHRSRATELADIVSMIES